MQNKIIEFRSGEKGFLIPHEDGIALGAMSGCEDEARRWFQRQKHYLQLELPVTVLGIGPGVHLSFMQNETLLPMTVIDTRPGVIRWARRIFKDTDIEFFHIEKANEIPDHPVLADRIGMTLPLIFEPAAGSEMENFKQMAEHFRGRSDEVWAQKNLSSTQARHWREWSKSFTDETIEQKILKEVLA